MQKRDGPAADWRDAAAYAPLLGADRSLFAWEWLRRDRGYRNAAELPSRSGGPASASTRAAAAIWGLHEFEPPALAVPAARPVWRREVHPAVLEAIAQPAGAAQDWLDIQQLGGLATIIQGGNGPEHLLLSDGLRSIRLDIVRGSLRDGPVQLRYRIAGLASAEGPLLSLRRLIMLCRSRRFAASLHPPEARERRFLLMLRAHDALLDGATQREIAATLLSAEAADDRWRVTAPTVRSRVQRLTRSARLMAAGGYLSLLGGCR